MTEVAKNRLGAPIWWCLGAAVLFGASTPASKGLLDAQVGPFTLAGLLYLGAALAMLPFASRGGAALRRRQRAAAAHRVRVACGGAARGGEGERPVT